MELKFCTCVDSSRNFGRTNLKIPVAGGGGGGGGGQELFYVTVIKKFLMEILALYCRFLPHPHFSGIALLLSPSFLYTPVYVAIASLDHPRKGSWWTCGDSTIQHCKPRAQSNLNIILKGVAAAPGYRYMHGRPRGMKLSKQVYEISNLLEISSDEYH